ncbi:MAG: hypothetical protein WBA22_09425 [Candidatus Methanofastidiosia archaeon]
MKKINQLKGVMTHPDMGIIVRIEEGVNLHSNWDEGNPSIWILREDLIEKVMP